MANFSDFLKSNESKQKKQEHKEATTSNNNISNAKIEELINKYSDYSGDSLLNEFMKLTLQKKQKGELNASELEQIKNTIMPYLSGEQKVALENIMNMVKNVK